jgi:DMSO reductase anchor subunit
MILAAQSIYLLQPAGGLEPVLTWMGCILSVLFLISTGLAYRFLAHPVWGSSMLPAYYVISATLIGFSLRAIGQPFTTFPIVFNLLVITQMILLIRYKNDIKTSSEKVLGELKKNPLKWILRGFLSASLFAPAALAMVSLLGRTHSLIYALIGFSCFMGMILERILFFRVERPNLFFSFIRHPGKKGDRLIRG